MPRHSFTSYFAGLLAGLSLLGSGCGSLGGKMDEGVIEYTMTFPDIPPDGLMSGMLPERSILTFNRENQVMDLSAAMGIFRTSMVVNTADKVVNYHMNMMGKNLVSELHLPDLKLFNTTPSPVKVVETGQLDTIAGYPCRKAILVYDHLGATQTEVWYTTEITMDAPNWYGPFSTINGVLMRYELVQHNVRMRLEAHKVKRCKVDRKKFEVRPDSQKVPPEVLLHELNEVLGTFGS